MRDPIREKDIEQALDITAGEVTVDVDDRGIATITLKRDHLDEWLTEDVGAHWGCRTDDDLDAARASGYGEGRRAAIADIEKLAAA